MKMMECKQIEKNLIFFIDKQLTKKEITDFELHINKCEHCNALFNNVSDIYLSIENHKNLPEDFYFYTRLQQRLKNKYSHIPAFSKRILQPITLSVFLLIGGFAGVFIGNQYKLLNITTEDYRNTQIKEYAEENYLSEINNENFEVLLTSNQ